jgi:hypothetical protein
MYRFITMSSSDNTPFIGDQAIIIHNGCRNCSDNDDILNEVDWDDDAEMMAAVALVVDEQHSNLEYDDDACLLAKNNK